MNFLVSGSEATEFLSFLISNFVRSGATSLIMSQQVHPTGFRLGITTEWKSRWFVRCSRDYVKNVLEDKRIRDFVRNSVGRAGIQRIEIERSFSALAITTYVARPGMIIGRGGSTIELLRSGLENICGAKPRFTVEEVKVPSLAAVLIADDVSRQIERRRPPRRVIISEAEKVMFKGAEGVKIEASGRLQGARIARKVRAIRGSVPLQTLRAKIDYAQGVAKTKYGTVGVKVWIHLGEETGN